MTVGLWKKKKSVPSARPEGLEAENERLRTELVQLRKDYEELKQQHSDYVLRAADLERRAASLNFQAFTLSKDNEALKLNVTGYRGERESLIAQMRKAVDEAERLRAELETLKKKGMEGK